MHVGSLSLHVSSYDGGMYYHNRSSFGLQRSVAQLLKIDERDCKDLRLTLNGRSLTHLAHFTDATDAQIKALRQEITVAWHLLFLSESPVKLVLTRYPKEDVALDAFIDQTLYSGSTPKVMPNHVPERFVVALLMRASCVYVGNITASCTKRIALAVVNRRASSFHNLPSEFRNDKDVIAACYASKN